MKVETALAWLAAGLVLSAAACLPMIPRFIWNRTESVPTGLYVLVHSPAPSIGDLVAYQPETEQAAWLEARRYTSRSWPLIKRIAALHGDEVCRRDNRIVINGAEVARALEADSEGRDLPVWRGCRSLAAGEIFLLADDPRSVDGRYLGPGDAQRILGRVIRIWPPALPEPETEEEGGGPRHEGPHTASLPDGR